MNLARGADHHWNHPMLLPVPGPRGQLEAEPVAAVTVSLLHFQVFPVVSGGHAADEFSVHGNVHEHRVVRLGAIPDISGDLRTGELFHDLVALWQGPRLEAAGKEQQAKGNRMKSEEDIDHFPARAALEPFA